MKQGKTTGKKASQRRAQCIRSAATNALNLQPQFGGYWTWEK